MHLKETKKIKDVGLKIQKRCRIENTKSEMHAFVGRMHLKETKKIKDVGLKIQKRCRIENTKSEMPD